MELTDKQKGIALSLIGVLVITPDSLFVRLIDLSSLELLFYRGLIPFFCLLILLTFLYKKKIFKKIVFIGLPGLFYAILIALGNFTFVISLENTNVANTLIMIALTPFATAILSAIFIKENPGKRMWFIIISCFLVVLFIFYDSFQGNRLYGDLFGLLAAIFVGGAAVVVRYSKSFDFLPALLFAKLLTFFIPLFLINSFPNSLSLDFKNLFLVIAMGICLFIPLTCITIAPKYIPAYEVEIFFVLETIIGPIWVWLIINEEPTIKTLIGGIVIILLILTHTFLELKKERKTYLLNQ